MPAISILVAQNLLALMFLASAASKASQFARFQSSVEAYRLLPTYLVAPASRFIPIVEFIVGGLLLLGVGTVWVGWVATTLMLVFSAAISIKINQKDNIGCGCGGFLGSHQISSWHLWRNLLLSVLAVLVALGSPSLAIQLKSLPLAIQWLCRLLALGLLISLAVLEEVMAIGRLIPQDSSSMPEAGWEGGVS